MKTLGIVIAGGLLVASLAAASAQGAPPASTPAADGCSFLDCLLHNRREAAAPPPQAAAPDAGSSVKSEPVRSELVKTEPMEAGEPARVKAKAVPVVTLAAGDAETPRLKALAAAMPRHRLHLVAGSTDEADLRLAPTLDDASGAKSLHLYSELLYVVAGPAINTLADLRDRQVSFGPADGATVAVARRAFAAAGVAIKETPLDTANALDGLATGDIDAIVILAPQPSPVLAKLRAPGLHLVDWPEASIVPTGARSLLLAPTSYPALAKGETHVLAVDAVLTLTPKGERSAAARGLFAALKQRTGGLARHGFDRLGADLEGRRARRVASVARR